MRRRTLIAAVPGAVLAGCGGGGMDVAGIGSGGTGISGGEGVGSGGTGITSAAVGSISGFGSVIVNGVHFEIDQAALNLNDTDTLKLGMTVQVRGVVSEDLQTGVASSIFSAADARGQVQAVDLFNGTLTVWSTTIHADTSTVFGGGLSSLKDVRVGDAVQIYGLPGTEAGLRATRIERVRTVGAPVISGTARAVDAASQTVQVGGLRVSFILSLLEAVGLSPQTLEGQLVRVRGASPAALLTSAVVEPWYPVTSADGTRLALEGLVTRYPDLGSMHVDGIPVDASGARISGRATGIGIGARVEVAGEWQGGVLVASRLKLRDAAPGTGGPGGSEDEDDDAGDYSARGNIGGFRSASEFRIQGQDIDAGGPGVVFEGGTAADLRNGRRVRVTGSRVIGDVLIAERVEFL